MAMIRRICKGFLFLGWMLIMWAVLSLVNLGSYWEAQKRLAMIAKVWGRGLAWIFGIKIKIVGNADDFEGGLVISNHTGYIDIIVHAAVLPLRFAPKSSIRKWPFIGWFVRAGRPVWIDRLSPRKSKLVAKQFIETMNNGIMMLVYPEGTSTSGKNGILKFKSTPFAAAVDGDNWVLPTIIRYGDTPDGKPIAWYDDMTLLPHLWRILGYKRMQAEVTIMKPFKPEGRNRKELAEYAHKKMEEEYIKIFESGDIIT